MGGLEVAHQFREDLDLQGAVLVALSGYSGDEDRRRSQEAGFNSHLTKPVQLAGLKTLLADLPLFTAGLP